jgi:hypothetical protein
MGRPSGTSFGPLIPGERMSAPTDMTEEAAREWTAITTALPSQWITPENAPLLRELCYHICYARAAREGIERAKAAGDNKAVARLLRMHGAQSERIASLSTKLHLSPSSRYRPERAERAARGEGDTQLRTWDDGPPVRKPWQS